MGIFDTIVSTGADFFSGAKDLIVREDSNRQASHDADSLKWWQQKNADSAYQRASVDLRKAGINPILAGKFGASATPAGAMASMQSSPGNFNMGTTAKTMQDTKKSEEETQTQKHKTAIAKADAIIRNNTIGASAIADKTTGIALEILEATGANNIGKTYRKLQELSRKAGGDAYTWYQNVGKMVQKADKQTKTMWKAIFDKFNSTKGKSK